MKKLRLLSLLCAAITLHSINAYAQTGTVSTVAGCNMCILTPVDGVIATMAEFYRSTGITLDASRNVYISDDSSNKVRRVLASNNRVYTFVGDSSSWGGFSGDGGLATNARLYHPKGICIDATNNLYIADDGNGRIRKVNAVTNIITTIAGGGVSTADGVAATTASLTPKCVFVDTAGNIYTGGSNKLRKINGTTGIITTVAGNGSSTDGGDGGLATAASIAGPIQSITMDATGNIYFVSNARNSVRKIDAVTGIISTVVRGGACPNGSITSCGIDASGNIITIDRTNKLIRSWDKINKSIYKIAGGGTSVAEGASALTAYVNGYMMYIDNVAGNIYYTDSSHWIRKMAYSPSSYVGKGTTGFSTTINKLCSGPKITVNTSSYSASLSIKTWFGDGQTNTTLFIPDCSGSMGYAEITHAYDNSGTYTIKQVLYSGTTPVDSIKKTYQHTLCNNFYVKNYYDINSNCLNESTDFNLTMPVLTQVDSNGVIVDTISSTNGFYYTAYGNTGDRYTFKIVSALYLDPNCPTSGIITDTLKSLTYNFDTTNIGFISSATSGFDIGLYTVPSYTRGNHQQITIYACNKTNNPVFATTTVDYSPKWEYMGGSGHTVPLPSTVAGNSLSWSIPMLSLSNSPVKLQYRVENNPATGNVVMGDTVNSHYNILPISGDMVIIDNNCDRNDTSTSSWDPNDISVSPGNGCVYSGNKLTYTVRFENTGNDTAFNIHVLDTLSDNLDLQSMRIIMASNSMDVIPIHTDGYNIIKFDFPNIYLPDSSHHGLSDGAFIFSINLKDGLPDGTQIPNRVGIYFDYNPVVLTNTVVNTIGCPTSVPEIAGKNNVALFPNPATNTLTIKMDDGAYSSCTISNTLGQAVMQQQLNGTHTNISVAALPPGMYYVTLYGEQENKVLKFVKQ